MLTNGRKSVNGKKTETNEKKTLDEKLHFLTSNNFAVSF